VVNAAWAGGQAAASTIRVLFANTCTSPVAPSNLASMQCQVFLGRAALAPQVVPVGKSVSCSLRMMHVNCSDTSTECVLSW
jgi:hypothetical protein